MKTIIQCLILCLACGKANAYLVQLTDEQVLQHAKAGLVGEVTHIESRTNDKGFIVTDVVLDVHDVLFDNSHAISNTHIMTLAGGKVNDQTLTVSYIPSFEIGQIVLVFLEDLNNQSFSPIVGSNQGVFFMKSPAHNHHHAHADVYSPRAFAKKLAWFKKQLSQRHHALHSFTGNQQDTHFHIQSIPDNSKIYDKNKRCIPVKQSEFKQQQLADTTPIESVTGELQPHQTIKKSGLFPFSNAKLPIKLHPLTKDAGELYGLDIHAIKIWNRYSNIFEVVNEKAPYRAATWAHKNGCNEIVGFTSNGVLKDFAGVEEMSSGVAGRALTVTDDKTGQLLEVDIILNPYSGSWRFNKIENRWQQGFVDFYNDVVNILLHELGHALGIAYEGFGHLSIMNYPPREYNAYHRIYPADVKTLHQLYPAQAKSVNDLGIRLYKRYGKNRCVLKRTRQRCYRRSILRKLDANSRNWQQVNHYDSDARTYKMGHAAPGQWIGFNSHIDNLGSATKHVQGIELSICKPQTTHCKILGKTNKRFTVGPYQSRSVRLKVQLPNIANGPYQLKVTLTANDDYPVNNSDRTRAFFITKEGGQS